MDPATRIGKVLSHVFPVMAPALALAADPDAALVRLERIAEAVGDRTAPADALAADPQAARRLAHLAAASSFATDLLVADPDRILALSGSLFGAPAVDSQAKLVEAVARTAGRELTPRETGEAIAAVAYQVIEEAVAAAEPGLPFAVDRDGQARRQGAERRERPRRRVRLRRRGSGRSRARGRLPPSA